MDFKKKIMLSFTSKSLIFILLFFACEQLPHLSDQFLSIKDCSFIDAEGRQILLHGINVVNKNSKMNYLGDHTPEEFMAMREWGLNCIRLGIIWDGLEPEPGFYDENYLKGVDQRIEWAKVSGLYVILDMHQDLYSVLYSDGAPEWATISDGLEFDRNSTVWSDAYFSSPAVQRALDHFWINSPAADGVGIQEHYARAWAHIAERYADEPMVVGYDIMNEPFPGSEAAMIFPMMLSAGAELFAKVDGRNALPVEAYAEKWITAEGRFEILNRLCDKEIYAQLIDVTEAVYAEFEKTKLMPMYQRVADAIREFDDQHILFLETTMGSNMGVLTNIQPLVTESGEREALQAYAPHGYDLVTDTKYISTPCRDRIELIFERHGITEKRLDMPMVVGEWGAFGLNAETLPAANAVVRQFEKLLCSDTYWDYDKRMVDTDHFSAIKRPYPERISGKLLSYRFDPETGVFECEWQEDSTVSAVNLIYIPDWYSIDEKTVLLSPSGSEFELKAVCDGSESRYISIPVSGKSIDRQLKVVLN